jgi:hypothetical protein
MDAGGSTPPSLGDFSQKAIQRAIRNEALSHPVTLYSAVATVLTALSWASFGAPLFLWAALGSAVLSAGSLIVNYCFRDRTLGESYIRQLNDRLAHQKESVLHSLQDELKQCGSISGAQDHVAQGLEQFIRSKLSYDNFREVLEQSFGAGRLDYGRIWGASEQAYLGVLDNLKQVATILKSLSTIDPDYIEHRLRQLDALAHLDDADKREQVTLMKRSRVREEQLRQVNEILTRNEEAITGIEEATAALAVNGSGDTFADVDPETSIRQLRELSEKTGTSRIDRQS